MCTVRHLALFSLMCSCSSTKRLPYYTASASRLYNGESICVRDFGDKELQFVVSGHVGALGAYSGVGIYELPPSAYHIATDAIVDELRTLGFQPIAVNSDAEALERHCDFYLQAYPAEVVVWDYAPAAGDYIVASMGFDDAMFVDIAGGNAVKFEGSFHGMWAWARLPGSFESASKFAPVPSLQRIDALRVPATIQTTARYSLRVLVGAEPRTEKIKD